MKNALIAAVAVAMLSGCSSYSEFARWKSDATTNDGEIPLGTFMTQNFSYQLFGVIPIVLAAIPGSPMTIIAVSACMAGAVCGDHCSPISDTSIMASAGARCDHIVHVNTQLPYALMVAAVSFVSYIAAAFVGSVWISLPIAIVLMLVTLVSLRIIMKG